MRVQREAISVVRYTVKFRGSLCEELNLLPVSRWGFMRGLVDLEGGISPDLLHFG